MARYQVEPFGEVADLRGYGAGRYAVTSDGTVISLFKRPPRSLSPTAHAHGHRIVKLYAGDGTKRERYVHDLVLEAWVGERPTDKPHTRHLNGDPSDNRVQNLAWGTASENQQDSLRHGTQHHAAKESCKRGHEFTEENTYRFGPDRRWRSCRECARLRERGAV